MTEKPELIDLTGKLYSDKTRGEIRDYNEMINILMAEFGQRGVLGSTVAFQQVFKAVRQHIEYVVGVFNNAAGEACNRLDCKPSYSELKQLTEKGEQIVDQLCKRANKSLERQFPAPWFQEFEKFGSEQKASIRTSIELLQYPLRNATKAGSPLAKVLVDPTLRVFVSSTIEDLKEERDAAVRAISDLRLQPVFSESFGAQSESPDQVIFDRLEMCHIYVGIFGSRYGSIPEGTGGRSVTHKEFDHGKKSGLPILIFEQSSITKREPKLVELLGEIKQYEKGFFIDKFETVDELEEKINLAILSLLARTYFNNPNEG